MARQTDIRQARSLLEGKTIERVEIMSDDCGSESPSLILYLRGMTLYVDAPALYSDDSGDAPAEF